MIFDEPALRKLSRLRLVARRVRSGVYKGERHSIRHGSSIEFSDHREYAPGDDLRRLDWNLYARSDRPFLKLMEDEEDLTVHILLDGSGSMSWGENEAHKFRFALRLAAALGVVALNGGDRLSLALLQDGSMAAQLGPLRGPHRTLSLLQSLDTWRSGGTTDLNRSVGSYLAQPRRPGIALVLSDLLCPGGYQEALRRLQGFGFEAHLLHLLCPTELDPPLAGDQRLVDTETRQTVEVSLDGGLRALYRRRLHAWCQEIRDDCRKRGAGYLLVKTDGTWESVVFSGLRRSGVLR